MEVHDEYIPEETFGDCLAHLPEVYVEVVVAYDGGVVLARRTNEPVNGEWFWPGGRLYKGERLDDVVVRIAREELGLIVTVEERLGVKAHFWNTASVERADTRHTVNVVYLVSPTDGLDITLDSQHDEWRLLEAPDSTLPEYVLTYVEEFDLL